jgi:aspartate/methionine/tyrosine aminotransferase
MLDAAKRLLMPSARSNVPPFMAMDVVAAAARIEAAGKHVIHMEVGQPAAPAPKPAIAAARAALGGRPIGYTETLGIPSLRARHYAETYRLEISPERRRHHRLIGRSALAFLCCSKPATACHRDAGRERPATS